MNDFGGPIDLQDKPKPGKPRLKKLWMALGVLIVINLLLYNLWNTKTGGYGLNGEYQPYDADRILEGSLYTLFLGVPLAAALLGCLVALFPYRGLTYGAKYLRSVLLVMLVLNGLFLGSFFVGKGVVALQSQTRSKAQREHAQERKVITEDFMIQMQAWSDSSMFVLQQAERELESGESPQMVGFNHVSALRFWQARIDSAARTADHALRRLGAGQEEIQGVIDAVAPIFEPVQQKFRDLQEKGVSLN